MMPIWFLAWIIPLCVFAGFVLFGLMFAADDSDAEAARLYQRQYEELKPLLMGLRMPDLSQANEVAKRHTAERREAGL